MRLANLLLVSSAVAAAFPLTTPCAVADGIPGVVMTDSQDVTDWSGVYIGGKVGGSWGHDDWLQLVPNFFDPTGSTDTTFSSSGVLGGILGGANLQMGQWVFGGELTFSGTGLSSTRAGPFFPGRDTLSTDLNWFATAEGRVGYSWDRVMIFGKGGWAGGGVNLRLNDSVDGVSASKDAFTGGGWTIGGGFDYAIWNGVLLGLEYDYINLRINNAALACGACGALGQPAIESDIKLSAVMLRMSYLFAAED
jgi:outer membrane immunogenic protein